MVRATKANMNTANRTVYLVKFFQVDGSTRIYSSFDPRDIIRVLTDPRVFSIIRLFESVA